MNGDEEQPTTSGGWQFKQDDTDTASASTTAKQEHQSEQLLPNNAPDGPPSAKQKVVPETSVSWTASEYIAHEKGASWYLGLMASAAAVALIDYVLTNRDIVSAVMIIVLATFFGLYAARKPRELEYHLDPTGLHIGRKRYHYEDFRSFAIMSEGAFTNITFMPLKRFSPSLTIYYSPQDEERIVNALGEHLPMEKRDHDIVDRFLQHIRF